MNFSKHTSASSFCRHTLGQMNLELSGRHCLICPVLPAAAQLRPTLTPAIREKLMNLSQLELTESQQAIEARLIQTPDELRKDPSG